jgi:hypothetical protein
MQGQAITRALQVRIEPAELDEETIGVYCWRMEQLLAAGYAHVLADALATDLGVDLHAACALLASGCPQAVAYRIVS